MCTSSILIHFHLIFNTNCCDSPNQLEGSYYYSSLPYPSPFQFNPILSSRFTIKVPYCIIYSNIDTGHQIVSQSVLFICTNNILTHMTHNHFNHDKLDIKFASTIAAVDKNIYVVSLFYWLYCNTAEPYTPATFLSVDTTIDEWIVIYYARTSVYFVMTEVATTCLSIV